MTIDEAIKNLQLHARTIDLGRDLKLHEATHLGIEALKRLKEHREVQVDWTFRALPGETEE